MKRDPADIEIKRLLFEEGAFRQKIIKREPQDFYSDKFTLACGHSFNLFKDISRETTEFNCFACAEGRKVKRIDRLAEWFVRSPNSFLVIYLVTYVFMVAISIMATRGPAMEHAALKERIAQLEGKVKVLEGKK
jgi:hypothetical protein